MRTRILIHVAVSLAFMPATATSQTGDAPPAAISSRAIHARLAEPVVAWCATSLRAGTSSAFAVAAGSKNGSGRYGILGLDSAFTVLAPYASTPELSCYSRAEAESLNAALSKSESIQGKLLPRFETTVVCGFVERTHAVCWQYSPVERSFVKVGEWVT